jgi:hypothetical protein
MASESHLRRVVTDASACDRGGLATRFIMETVTGC